MLLAATTVLKVALAGTLLPTFRTLFFVDGRAYYLEAVLLTRTPEILELVRGALPQPGPEESWPAPKSGRRLPAIPDTFKAGQPRGSYIRESRFDLGNPGLEPEIFGLGGSPPVFPGSIIDDHAPTHPVYCFCCWRRRGVGRDRRTVVITSRGGLGCGD